MKYVIISENLEFGKELQSYFKCDLYGFLDEFEYSNYDFFILMYDVAKGNSSVNVRGCLSKIQNSYVALVGRGNTGFDINSILMKNLQRNKNLVVYSRYCKRFDCEEIYSEITNKIVRTDGREYSEKLAGFLSRIFLRRGR